MSNSEQELADLDGMTPAQLRAEWRDCWRKPAPAIGPDLLRRGIAWKKQSRLHGDLPQHVRREIEAILTRLTAGKPAVDDARISFRPGTRLVREWRGRVHEVAVVKEGYVWQGACYRSLSEIAHRITGTRWNGWVFFGLKKSGGGGKAEERISRSRRKKVHADANALEAAHV